MNPDSCTEAPEPSDSWEEFLEKEFRASGGAQLDEQLSMWGAIPIDQKPLRSEHHAMPPDSFFEEREQRCLLGLRLNGALVATSMGRNAKAARREMMNRELPRIMALYEEYIKHSGREYVSYEEFYRRKRATELHPKSEADQQEQLHSYLDNLQWYVHYLYGENAPSKAYLFSQAPSLAYLSRHLEDAIMPVQMLTPPPPPLHPIEVFLLLSPVGEIMKNINHSYRRYTAARLQELEEAKKSPLRTSFHSHVDTVRAIFASFPSSVQSPSSSSLSSESTEHRVAPPGEKSATRNPAGVVTLPEGALAKKATAMVQRFVDQEKRLTSSTAPREGEKNSSTQEHGAPDPSILFPNLLFTNRLNMILPHWDRPAESRHEFKKSSEEEQRQLDREDKAFRVNYTPHLCLQSHSLHPASFTQIYQSPDALDSVPPVQWDNY